MKGFRQFVEEDKSQFVGIVKKQLGVPKTLWIGMPVLVSNCKLGKYEIQQPTNFIVSSFDDIGVTIRRIADPTVFEDDPDDEIDPDEDEQDLEITISLEDFYKLLEPPPMPSGGGMGGLI